MEISRLPNLNDIVLGSVVLQSVNNAFYWIVIYQDIRTHCWACCNYSRNVFHALNLAISEVYFTSLRQEYWMSYKQLRFLF